MFDYLQKFNNLPKELRDKVSSKEVMDKVLKLENKYGVELAALIMKVMIKTVPIKSLPRYISSEFSLGAEDAKELSNQLFVHVFSNVADHLGIKDEFKKNKEYNEISELLNKAGIKLASDDLLNRLKNIILTYKKGVRDKINTKNSLAKPVEIGGLGLSDEEIDKVFLVISKGNKDLNRGQNIDKNTSRDKLDRIIKEAEGLSGAYDLKKAIEEKNKQENKDQKEEKNEEEIKKIAEVEKLKNLPLEEEEKSFPKEDKELYFRKPEKTLNLPLEKEEEDEEEISKEETKNDKVENKEKDLEKSDISEDTLKKEIDKEIRNLENRKNKKEDKEFKSEEGEIGEEGKREEEKTNEKKVNNKIVNNKKENKELDDQKNEEDEKEEIKEGEDVESEKTEEVKLKKARENKDENKKEEEKEREVEVSNKIPVNPNFKRPAPGFSSKKPVLDDIKPVSKMMNPIEELKFLNLKNFRRLGGSPEESCKRIFGKIKLLERDGYDKMIKGIKAWHSSEVNQLYVKIGRESILKGKKMREIIVERQKRNLPVLKEEEVKAIANLNSRLVF